MKKNFIIILFLACSYFSLNGDGKYLFLQTDLGSMNVIAPIINLGLLDKMKHNEKYVFNELDWRTSGGWLEYSVKYSKAFSEPFEKINDPKSQKKYPNIVKFLNSVVENGPVFPHFYNKKNDFINKGLSGVDSLFLTPYFMIDVDALGKTSSDCECTLFNLKKEVTDAFKGISFSYFPEGKTEGKLFVFNDMGWYKLMFLRLGLSSENSPLNEDDSDHSIYKELDYLFNKNINNPWNSKNFTKEMFLQYELAEIFKQNRNLFEKSKLVVDFFLTPWKAYENLKNGNCFRADGSPYDFNIIKEFLPGEEQILAYYFVQNLMLLWYGANSNSIFGSDGIRIPALFRLFKRFTFSKFSLKENDNVNVFSFMDVWHEILAEFCKKSRKNWISFSGHGALISFDQDLINKQLNVGTLKDKELLKLLQFTLIDSCFGERMNIFYKNPSESEIKSYTEIFMGKAKKVWEKIKDNFPKKVR